MSYTKGSTYIWSDGEWLHLWADEGLDHWKSMEQYADKPGASGVQISERVADHFAVMRFAELLKSGETAAAIEQALAQWTGNFGCSALEDLGPVIRRFCEVHPFTSRHSQEGLGMDQRSNEVSTPVARQFSLPLGAMFALGDRVRKKSGAAWQGQVVGWYCTKLTPEGYAVESESHPGSVQIYPAAALERVV